MAKIDPKIYEEHDIFIKSTMDGTLQPSLFFRADGEGKRPLLIALHSWSHDRSNQMNKFLSFAQENGFHLLLPEFRGKNLESNPECQKTCCSEFAKQDIQDAIDYCIEHENADKENVFLIGFSGGGMMALMMAAKIPEYFRAVGAFGPLTDLTRFVDYSEKYRKHVIACCSGEKEEMARRSPFFHIDQIAKANVKIFHGKQDPVVPVAYSLDFYNEMMRRHPDANIYIEIFEGVHAIVPSKGKAWVMEQYKKGLEERAAKESASL